MIKSNPLAVLLVTVLFLSALVSSWCSVRWFFGAKELQSMEYQFQSLNRISAAMQSLANDAMEYSRRNPAIDPVLAQFDLKPRPGAPPPVTQPPLKPAR
jgi:hypothetical protein